MLVFIFVYIVCIYFSFILVLQVKLNENIFSVLFNFS